MRSLIIISVFIFLVGILFYSLFKQPINKNNFEIRQQLRELDIAEKQKRYAQRQLTKCRKDLFLDAHEYVDSLVRSLEVNPANEQDPNTRRYRPSIDLPISTESERVELEPLFEKVDSLHLQR